MNTLDFVVTIVLVTASGALAPGPLFFATISHGARSGAKSGLVFSISHTLIEFSLVMLLAGGLLTIANEPIVRLSVGVVGGIVLVVFGVIQIHNFFKSPKEETKSRQVTTWRALLIGLSFTGLNPYFVIWWLTAGAKLILLSLDFASFSGVILMYACHVWMDYLWLTSIAHFARLGTNIVGFRWYRVIMIVFGAILVYFGLTFLLNAF
jgi:threonine/homoserine/homoserine lactone efflux protein